MIQQLKNNIKILLFKLIELIEKKEFKNNNFDENEPLKKVRNITFLKDKDVYVDSPEGWIKIEEINETQPYRIHYIKTEYGKELYCADNHLIFLSDLEFDYVQNIKIGEYIQTKNGLEKVIIKENYNIKNSMVDFTVDSPYDRYYTNDILSHNTISAAITILHYNMFNVDKGTMIAANKASTVIEIIDKIKNIYKQLPYFLKAGIINWSNRTLAFDNGCRIKSEARTKEPSIGFTIDFLYMDEFAHVPKNIIEPYYRSIIPTVSSISNSKIIITSTPNGTNMFHKLWEGANLPKGSLGKNPYKPLKVMWYQVPGRLDTKVYLNELQMESFNITRDIFEEYLLTNNLFFEAREEADEDGNIIEFYALQHDSNKTLEDYRALEINGHSLISFSIVTNWEEQQTALIGSKESFDQEYNLHFLVGSKRMLDAELLMNVQSQITPYNNIKIKELDEKLGFGYEEFLFTENLEDFNIERAKQYYGIHTIDLSEGVGGDDSVINNLRCMPMTKDEIDNVRNPTGIHDYFKLKQIGRYNFNKISVPLLSKLYYVWAFDTLNPNNWKTILEANMFGGEFTNQLPMLFNRNNNYGSFIMCKFKHRADAKEFKIGIKVTAQNKNLLIKDFQDYTRKNQIQITDIDTFNQLNNFVKHEKETGHILYKAESGHDDIIMSTIHAAQFLKTQDWKIMCERVFNTLDKVLQDYITDALNNNRGSYNNSLSSLLKTAKNYTGRFKKYIKQ